MEPLKMDKKSSLGLDFSKETINVIRTTLRNNIELTAIADNKANVLLSLNALLIASVVPLAISNLDFVIAYFLHIPLVIMAITCFSTIYLTTLVLAPTNFDTFNDRLEGGLEPSPFFFATIHGMSLEEYYLYLQQETTQKEVVRLHLAQDLYFIGYRLAEKMKLIRTSFHIFRIGIFLAMITSGLGIMLNVSAS
jgi:hypothetical protein